MTAIFEEADKRVDLIISDVRMPRLSGPDLIREVVAKSRGVKAILMSGYSDEHSRRLNVPFLAKPFTAAALCALTEQCLNGSEPEGAGEFPGR